MTSPKAAPGMLVRHLRLGLDSSWEAPQSRIPALSPSPWCAASASELSSEAPLPWHGRPGQATVRKNLEGPSPLMPGYGFQMSPSPYSSGHNQASGDPEAISQAPAHCYPALSQAAWWEL